MSEPEESPIARIFREHGITDRDIDRLAAVLVELLADYWRRHRDDPDPAPLAASDEH